MTMWGRNPVLVIIPLLMNFGSSVALTEPQICYLLDGVLFLYGIVLTALYCGVKIQNARAAKALTQKQTVEEGIYTGLTPRAPDTYETIGLKK